MTQKLFYGTCTALITPFYNGAIDYHTLEKHLDRQIQAGIGAIVVGGTTGEGATLSDEEKAELLRFCKQHVGSSCTVIAGTGSNSTAHAVSLSVDAQSHGADALLVVSPYYNKASNAGLIAHYSKIAEEVSIPVIIYNVPSRTGLDIPVSVYRELSTVGNIAGVKEASADIRKVQDIRKCCPEEFAIWSGNDDMICASMAIGADGVISVTSNILPFEVRSMTDAALLGDYKKAAALQRQLLPMIDALFCEVNPIPVKYAMQLLGLDRGGCRLPLTEPSQAHKILIQDTLKAFKS